MTDNLDPQPKRPQRRRISESDALFALSQSKRIADPLVIRDVPVPIRMALTLADMRNVNVDERYQRLRITDEVNRLIHVLKAGGLIPDPISLARRTDGSFWILDGQQRFLAYWECDLAIPAADVYDVTTLEQEMQLFQVFNSRVGVNSETLVKSWVGPIGVLIRTWAEQPEYKGRVSFGKTGSSLAYSSTILVRGALAAAAGVMPTGSIKTVMARADAALKDPMAVQRADAYLRLLPLVFPPDNGRVKMIPAVALGRVSARRWATDVRMPLASVYERLKKLRWDSLAPTHAAQFTQLLETAIEKIWKEGKDGHG